MILAIIGSRLYTNYEEFKEKVEKYLLTNNIKPDKIISGGAIGVDEMAKRWADENKIQFDALKPDYKNKEMIDRYGKKTWGKMAPLANNKRIAEKCNRLIAFARSDSGGTLGTVNLMMERNKPCFVFDLPS